MQSKNNKFYPVSMDYTETDNYAMFTPLQNFKKLENFQTTAPVNAWLNADAKQNRTLLGIFEYCGLNARIGCLSSRDVWTNELQISDWDLTEREIKQTLPELAKLKAQGFPIILEFADLSGTVQASFYYTNSYTRFGVDNRPYEPKLPEHRGVNILDIHSYEFALNEPQQVIFDRGPAPIYKSIYVVYFYPKYIIDTDPGPIPSGKILLQLVQENEFQIHNLGKQICVQNTGAFFPPGPSGTKLPSDYSISGLGLPNGTMVTGFNIGPSTPLGIYKDCLYLDLTNPVNILVSDGNFYVPPPPPTPPPPTTKPGSTPGPPTPKPTQYSALNPNNVPTNSAVLVTTQPQRSSNFIIALFEELALFFSNLFRR